ncbi:MAG: Gfo/Idh/MocA family oxidoreductase [Magnetococcales bacterium]|nr:Gfo/Idh/MocA family oxidoreductase [Magnetococcales bacterium]
MVNRVKGPLAAAVIGVGYLGRFHAQKYARMAGVELVAVADHAPERAGQVGRELGVAAVGDWQSLLPRLDLVSVVTPTNTHFSVVRTCLRAGVHVLVEKPMTVTLEEARELIALAEAEKRVLQVGHLKRFHPTVTALTESGLLRQPRFIESHRLAPFKNRALDVDVVLDLMIHDVDLMLHFIGSPVVDVESMGARVVTGEVDIAHARLKFANGAIAHVSASRVARGPMRQMRIFQPDAMIELDFIRQELSIRRRGAGEMVRDGLALPAIEESLVPVARYDTLEREIQSFCDAVRGAHPPVVSGEDGLRALEVVTAIRRGIGVFAQGMGL